MLIAMKVAPRGLPRWRRREEREAMDSAAVAALMVVSLSEARFVFRRKSCVIAMPMDANESDVRSQARKVRSILTCVY